MNTDSRKKPQIWGGVECTVNRVGDSYFDQTQLSGHQTRLEDLDRIAELGIKKMRYPIVWERIAPESPDELDWSWSDERLSRASELGIEIIGGLVHHGSGPKYTSLLDPLFAEKLGDFAGKVAERYPWIQSFTPVNEPLTTARFSGLYGHWYPHTSDYPNFLRMLINECRGTVVAMKNIRRVSPKAQLVQTEDMGKIFSTPFLKYQADFENERRWLSLDLLTGRVNRDHPLWDFCVNHGVTEDDLAFFSDNPCPPDIIGLNHYITSNRYLDERIERYPSCYHGGNTLHRYADVEAILVGAENLVGHGEVLREAWNRYKIPVAATEVHIGSTRDEQLRWLAEAWDVAHRLIDEGVDMRAITVWAMLGSYDWNSLVTQMNGFYEPGAFDLRGASPRPTALADQIESLAKGKTFDHPVLDTAGWWHRSDRLKFAPVSLLNQHNAAISIHHRPIRSKTPREILITGSPGSLAYAFSSIWERRGLPYRLLSRRELDITDQAAVRDALVRYKPWAVINAAGYSRVDLAEHDVGRCERDNIIGPSLLSRSCAELGIRFMTFSSHLVFNGKQSVPYCESNLTEPLSAFGRSKEQAEKQVLQHFEDALVIRAGDFFGPWDQINFLSASINQIMNGRNVPAFNDLTVSPSYLPDLADSSLDLLIDGEKGIWHLANQGWATQSELIHLAAKKAKLDTGRIVSMNFSSAQSLAPRPIFGAMRSEKAQLLPSVEFAIDRYVRECRLFINPRKFEATANPYFVLDEIVA